MPIPRISSRAHGVLDYTTGAALLAAPRMLGLRGTAAGAVLRAAGAGHIGYSLLTDYELGVAKVLPYRAHLAIDAAAAAGLAALGPGRPRAVLLADLPCLRPHDLGAALDAADAQLAAGRAAAVVPDAAGTGTVLLAQGPGPVRPTRFGPGSAAAHAADGAVRLELALPRLRRDVDTPADLEAALALGVGPATLAALAALAGPRRAGA